MEGLLDVWLKEIHNIGGSGSALVTTGVALALALVAELGLQGDRNKPTEPLSRSKIPGVVY